MFVLDYYSKYIQIGLYKVKVDVYIGLYKVKFLVDVYIPNQSRPFKCQKSDVEQDVMTCQKYEYNRDQLFNIMINKVPNLQLSNVDQQFIYLLNPENNVVLK